MSGKKKIHRIKNKTMSRHSKVDKTIRHMSSFSRAHLLVVALVFGAIGGYILIKSFAAPLPPDVKIIDPDDTGSFASTFDIAGTVQDNVNPSNGTQSLVFRIDGASWILKPRLAILIPKLTLIPIHSLAGIAAGWPMASIT
jgi:hypothetical protein